MNGIIELFEVARAKTGGTMLQYIVEAVIPKEDGSLDIDLPVGYFLWATRINVHDDAVWKIQVYRLNECRFEDYWQGIKATIFMYLGRMEPPGFATIFWPHVFGKVEGLDLREEIVGRWKLRIIPNTEGKIKVKLAYMLIDTPLKVRINKKGG